MYDKLKGISNQCEYLVKKIRVLALCERENHKTRSPLFNFSTKKRIFSHTMHFQRSSLWIRKPFTQKEYSVFFLYRKGYFLSNVFFFH